MKKKLFLTAILTLICCTLLIAGASADITPTQPTQVNGVYQIGTAEELYWFAGLVNGTLGDGTSKDTAANAVLTADITINKDIDYPTYNWTPIGDNNNYYGTFDGQGHTISGLYYNVSDDDYVVYAGLFGSIGSNGTVMNVKIADSYISASTGEYCCVGGVCGGNYGTITNCGFSGTGNVSGDSGAYVGGVCGVNQGVIKECYNNGTIKTEVGYAIGIAAGGVCGYNVETIENCYNTGTVTGYYAGGVCGYNNGGTITNCYWLKEEGSNLEGIGNDTDMATQVDSKTANEFKSGEVAWRLNQGQTGGPWRQNLSEDDYPVLDSNRGEVVKLTVDDDVSYHNSPFEFEGETGRAYFDEDGKRIDLPYEVTKDTILTSKTLVTVTADDIVIFVGDESPDLTFTTSPEVLVDDVKMLCAYDEIPGEYDILIDGPKVQGDYAFDYVYGTLTVSGSWIVTVDGEVNYVKPGDTFKMPPAPSKPGYIFMGWSDGKTTWQPNNTVDITSDLTIKSVWANMPDITPTEPDEGLPFTDVPEGAWYYEAVKQVYEAGLMNGVTDTLFDPDGTMTRAMFWTILARASGMDTDGGATWYAVAQQWAVENGVSDGTDAMGALTREQLVTMLWRLNGEPVVNYLITTPDANQISPWALEAMKWAASTGLIEGDENGNLTPTATCTRAQAATFLVRYLTTE